VVAVVFSIVYTGEHYVSDALAGALLAFVSWRLVLALAARRLQAPVAATRPAERRPSTTATPPRRTYRDPAESPDPA
jgi:membrane-associated phospholipid phosphatase